MRNDFCAVILSHGRADNVITYKSLRSHGYTGRILILIDDQDEQRETYISNYGQDVIVFDKSEAYSISDPGNNSGYMGSVLFARNMVHDLVRESGYQWFVMLDDDYNDWRIRLPKGDYLSHFSIDDLDKVFEIYRSYYESIDALTLSFAQGGDFIGGVGSRAFNKYGAIRLLRKSMNVFFCSVDRPFQFYGIMNDDVNMYLSHGIRGQLCLTAPQCSINQLETQANQGGLTDMYLELGTYVKSFYSVMYSPSSVVVYEMGVNHKRLHHKINWEKTTPKILSEKWRKATTPVTD